MTFQSMTGFRGALVAREAGPYGWLTPFIADIANQHPAFASQVLCLTRAELHFLGLASVAINIHPDGADRREAFVRAYATVERRVVLTRYAFGGNRARATAVLKLSRKIAGDLWRPASYCGAGV
ncbi:MAG: hypothetical protein AAGK25_04405 [Pseudomonadota bacterium]